MSARIPRRAAGASSQAKPAEVQMVRLRARPRPHVRRWLKTFLLDSVF